MAEFVSKSVEDMLPELEQLERVRLFSKEEIRTILKKRQQLEYRLRKKTRREIDYLHYIQYEKNVLALIKKRREMVGYSFKKEKIEVPIVQRIYKLFQLCHTRFPESLDVWLQHIEFSKQRKDYRYVSRTFASLLRIMNKNPEIWVKAAQWEASQSNLDTARTLMQRGISFNSSSHFLWTEFYKMELVAAEMLRKGSVNRDKAVHDPTMDGRIAEVVLKNAIKEFPGDIQIVTSLMEVCKDFIFARPHLDLLITELREKYPKEPAMWNTLARHLLPTKNGKILQTVTDEEEERCLTTFRQSVLEAPGEQMWSLYLKTCLELLHLPADTKRREKRVSRALDVFSTASQAAGLSEEMYIDWFGLLTDTLRVEEAERVGDQGVTRYPTCVQLWQLLLVLKCQTLRPAGDVLDFLQKALASVAAKDGWHLWRPALDHLVALGYEGLADLLEKATLRLEQGVGKPARLYRLRWTFLTHGIVATRTVFKTTLRPVPLEFYMEYANMEMSQSNIKMKRVRKAFEEASSEYGDSEAEVWLQYIQAEMTSPGGNVVRVGELHQRALAALAESPGYERFVKDFNAVSS